MADHQIGHLPFEADISEHAKYGQENRITVVVGKKLIVDLHRGFLFLTIVSDNTLIGITIPQGTVEEVVTDHGKEKRQHYTFDFFNYAGIHRSVHLVHTPQIHIEDVILNTDVTADGVGVLTYKIISNANDGDEVKLEVNILDRNGTKVATAQGVPNQEESITVSHAKLWWPYLMHSDPGYLYDIEIRLSSPAKANLDVYRMKFGFRKLAWNDKQFLINGKPIYFRGFGRHEDSDVSIVIRG